MGFRGPSCAGRSRARPLRSEEGCLAGGRPGARIANSGRGALKCSRAHCAPVAQMPSLPGCWGAVLAEIGFQTYNVGFRGMSGSCENHDQFHINPGSKRVGECKRHRATTCITTFTMNTNSLSIFFALEPRPT